jgi:hypothetical protein
MPAATLTHDNLIPDPDAVRRRLAVVVTEAELLRAQLRVCRRMEKERERLRGLQETAPTGGQASE